MVSCLNMLHLTVQSEGLLFVNVTAYCTDRGYPVKQCYILLYRATVPCLYMLHHYCTERGSPVYTCYVLLYRATVPCLYMLHLTVQSDGPLFIHVTSYCTERGSPVYTCSLDAQGAFDAIPHAVVFRKAMDVLPGHCWMITVHWYRAMCVQIKWGSALSEQISVHKCTQQGGLSSPFLFSLFYQDIINEVSVCTGGIIINNQSFHVLGVACRRPVTALLHVACGNPARRRYCMGAKFSCISSSRAYSYIQQSGRT